METLTQPLTARNPLGEIFQAWVLADLLKSKEITKYAFAKMTDYKKVSVFNRPKRFLIATVHLPQSSILTDTNKVFEVQIDGQFQPVQFLSDFAASNNMTLQGAIKHAKENKLLVKLETSNKFGCNNLVRITTKK